MRRNFFSSAVLIGLMLLPCGASARNLPAGYQPSYTIDFSAGLPSCATKQGAVSVVNAPGGISGKALKAQLRKSDGFPSSGIDLGQCGKIRAGHDYMIMWNTYIPPDTLVDSRQSDGMLQVRSENGTVLFRFSLAGNRYVVDIGNEKSSRHDAGPAGGMGKQGGDKGYWIRWALHYFPDPSGKQSVTELYKNNALVLTANGEPNAASGSSEAGMEVGIFRPGWKDKPSGVSRRTMYFSDIIVGVKP